jgi:hypothetical protein
MNKQTNKPSPGKGRPSLYTPELADRICELISSHSIGLVSLCNQYPDLPSPSSIRKWLADPDKSDFLHQYEISLSMRADNLFEEILEIADSVQIGETITTKAGEQEVTQADMIQHRRLRIEARKWIVSKLLPKKYGDSTQIQTNDKDEPVQPPKIEIVISESVVNEVLKGRDNES